MAITDAGNFLQEISEVGMLGETGKLALAMLADVDNFLHSRFVEQTKKLLGSLSRESDRAK